MIIPQFTSMVIALSSVFTTLQLMFFVYCSDIVVDHEHSHAPGDPLAPPMFSLLLRYIDRFPHGGYTTDN